MDYQPQHAVRGVPDELRTNIRECAIRYPHIEYTEFLVSQTFQGVQPLDHSPHQADPLHTVSTALQRCAPVTEARRAIAETVEVTRDAKKAIMGVIRLHQDFKSGSFNKSQLQRSVLDPLPIERRPEVPVLSRRALRSTPRIFSSAKDKNTRAPTKLVQLFKESGKFKVAGEMPVGPYEDGRVTLEDALLLERELDAEVEEKSAEWTTSMKREYLRVMREAKTAGAPACWESMMAMTKQQIEGEPTPLSPSILPRKLLDRKPRDLADLSKIGETYQKLTCQVVDNEELVLRWHDGRDKDRHNPISAFEALDSQSSPVMKLLPLSDGGLMIFTAGRDGQVAENKAPWKTKRMIAMGHDIRPEMHIMSLSNLEATAVAKERDERIKYESSSVMSTPRNGFRPRKNRVVSPPSDPVRPSPAPTSLRPARQVTLIGPPPDLLASSASVPRRPIQELDPSPNQQIILQQVDLNRNKRLPPTSDTSTTSTAGPSTTSATTTISGSTRTSAAPATPRALTAVEKPIMSMADQLAMRRRLHNERERVGDSTNSSSGWQRRGGVLTDRSTVARLATRMTETMRKSRLQSHSTPKAYNDLSRLFARSMSRVEEVSPRLSLPPANYDTVAAAAGCSTTVSPPMDILTIRNVWIPQDLAEELLEPQHSTYHPPPSPPVGTAEIDESLAELSESEEPWSPLNNTEVRQITYMPVPKASSSKLPATSMDHSRPHKKLKTKHVILQDGGSLDEIVRVRARSIAPSVDVGEIRPPSPDRDTLDQHLQLLGKSDMVQKKIASKVQPKPIRAELLSYAAAKPKSSGAPAPAKKADWRDHPILQNPAWYDKMARAPQAKHTASTILTAVSFYRNRPLVSALEAGGFTLLEHDLPGQGVDVILSATTGVIFRPLKDIAIDLNSILDCIKLASQFFPRVILILEAMPYRQQDSTQDVDVSPLTPAVFKAIPGLSRATARSSQGKSSTLESHLDILFAKNGAPEVVNVLRALLEVEVVGMRRNIGDVDAAEVYDNQHWLSSDEDFQTQWLTENFNLNSFSAAYVLFKARSLQEFLYEWTEGDRTLQFRHVIGGNLIKRINEHLRPEQASDQPVPSSDPLNLRPPPS